MKMILRDFKTFVETLQLQRLYTKIYISNQQRPTPKKPFLTPYSPSSPSKLCLTDYWYC
ncbi:hypothetical protein LC653_18305 [Nostoc sp. CHAB 5784]|uniref:hypothetical protein n=1 Tax=Nostoc mirabile TaxID=2907820 RepID=UPI001E573A8C|nr:hypothetical protein [Nostoc mirabile]MCC5665821.1 hypothetical protein [Nostoc mirabile CHAB5784]